VYEYKYEYGRSLYGVLLQVIILYSLLGQVIEPELGKREDSIGHSTLYALFIAGVVPDCSPLKKKLFDAV
jgi:hypothetical protein